MKNWKKQFDEKFPANYRTSDENGKVLQESCLPHDLREMKSFISSILLSQRKEVISIIENEMDKPLTQGEWKVLDNILNKLK